MAGHGRRGIRERYVETEAKSGERGKLGEKVRPKKCSRKEQEKKQRTRNYDFLKTIGIEQIILLIKKSLPPSP